MIELKGKINIDFTYPVWFILHSLIILQNTLRGIPSLSLLVQWFFLGNISRYRIKQVILVNMWYINSKSIVEEILMILFFSILKSLQSLNHQNICLYQTDFLSTKYECFSYVEYKHVYFSFKQRAVVFVLENLDKYYFWTKQNRTF